MSFHRKNGRLYCEAVAVEDAIAAAGRTPFYLYSLARVRENFTAYAASDPDVLVAYALKANNNLHLLRRLVDMGAGAVLVSGGELRLASEAGFDPTNIVFNGNGKTRAEIESAIEAGVMVNVDSEFDVGHIAQAASSARRARVLLRVNPDIDPKVHPYISTGIRESKFGIAIAQVPGVLDRLQAVEHVDVIGVHCHLGSTVADLSVYREAALEMRALLEDMRGRGIDAHVVNMGGGLGIDDASPSPQDLVRTLREAVGDVKLIVEPGRSVVGDAGVLVAAVVGVKRGEGKQFIVVDASMAELIRPSLYNAEHPIELVESVEGNRERFDVVGPVCESGDFLGKARELPAPREGHHLVVYEAGAYGYAMSSNYNARPRPAEYLVDGDKLVHIRRHEQADDLLRLFDV